MFEDVRCVTSRTRKVGSHTAPPSGQNDCTKRTQHRVLRYTRTRTTRSGAVLYSTQCFSAHTRALNVHSALTPVQEWSCSQGAHTRHALAHTPGEAEGEAWHGRLREEHCHAQPRAAAPTAPTVPLPPLPPPPPLPLPPPPPPLPAASACSRAAVLGLGLGYCAPPASASASASAAAIASSASRRTWSGSGLGLGLGLGQGWG